VNAPSFIWPVYGFVAGAYFKRETVAEFFNWGDAAEFAMRPESFGGELRELFVSEPRYDRRESGYHAPLCA
jgi:hypothetical protein